MSPTYSPTGYIAGLTAGSEVSSTYEGRHINVVESALVHPSHTDGFADKGDPVVVGEDVGVALNAATAATDIVVVDTEGIWNLSVIATDSRGNTAVAYGDELFINTTTALISKDRNENTSRAFGTAKAAVTTGSTGVIAVKVHREGPNNAYVVVGTSAVPWVNDTAGVIFQEYRYDCGATSGDARAMYLRLYLTGAGGGGEAARIFTTVEDVAGATARGAHISLNFGDTGSITGLGVGLGATLHCPNAVLTGGTYAGAQSELWFDGATSDISGTTAHSIHRFTQGGNATGLATAVNALEFAGLSANQYDEAGTSTQVGGIQILVNGDTKYIMISDDTPT